VDNGRRITCGAAALPAALEAAAARTDAVGLMFHHAVYADPAGRSELDEIAARLGDLPAADFRRLGELAAA
jgi:hypothetical protein